MTLRLTKSTTALVTAGALLLGTAGAGAPARAAESSGTPSAAQLVERAQRSLGVESGDSTTIEPMVGGEPTSVAASGDHPPVDVTAGGSKTRSGASIEYTSEQIDDGTRFAAVIRSSSNDQPTWDFGSGIQLYPLSDGRVSVSDADGNFRVGIDAPWAVDANGTPLTTYFTADGSRLVQHIETSANTVYPVVADPTVKSYPGYWEVTFNRSESATVVGTVAGCAALLSKSPVPALKALSVGCGVFAAFSGAQLAGGKCVRAHVVGIVPVVGTWWPTFPQC
jgi:hypothetical protein